MLSDISHSCHIATPDGVVFECRQSEAVALGHIMTLISMGMLVAAALLLMAIVVLWYWRRSSTITSSQSQVSFTGKETNQAAFLAGLPSQEGAYGVESALPFLAKTELGSEST